MQGSLLSPASFGLFIKSYKIKTTLNWKDELCFSKQSFSRPEPLNSAELQGNAGNAIQSDVVFVLWDSYAFECRRKGRGCFTTLSADTLSELLISF